MITRLNKLVRQGIVQGPNPGEEVYNIIDKREITPLLRKYQLDVVDRFTDT